MGEESLAGFPTLETLSVLRMAWLSPRPPRSERRTRRGLPDAGPLPCGRVESR